MKYAIKQNLQHYRYNSDRYHYAIVTKDIKNEMAFVEPVETANGRLLKTKKTGNLVQWVRVEDLELVS